MLVNIFEFRMREDADFDAYNQLAADMSARASQDEQFGFLGLVSYDRGDGSGVVIERFASAEGMKRWAADPEHRAAQERGRTEFYESFRDTVCTRAREYAFPAAE
jgi:heme-degrading monooxygenase HmoA